MYVLLYVSFILACRIKKLRTDMMEMRRKSAGYKKNQSDSQITPHRLVYDAA